MLYAQLFIAFAIAAAIIFAFVRGGLWGNPWVRLREPSTDGSLTSELFSAGLWVVVATALTVMAITLSGAVIAAA